MKRGLARAVGGLVFFIISYYCVGTLVFLWRLNTMDLSPQARRAYYRRHPGPQHQNLVPNATFTTEGHIMARHDHVVLNRINSLGFRGREYAVKRGQELRIAFLGDSVTFGTDADEASIFTTRVENELPRRLRHPRPVEALNLGNGASNLRTELLWYNRVGRRMDPDVVVWEVLGNDAMDDHFFYTRYEEFKDEIGLFLPGLYDPVLTALTRRHGSWNFFYRTGFGRFLSEDNRYREEHVQENLLAPLRTARETFGPKPRVFLLVFAYPNRTADRVRQIARSEGYEILDLEEFLHLERGPDPEVVLDVQYDHHFSPEGHRRVSGKIIDFLAPRL